MTSGRIESYTVSVRRNLFMDNARAASEFYDVSEVLDHGQSAGDSARNKKDNAGVLMIAELRLSSAFTEIHLNDEQAYMVAMKAIALIGGFSVVVWALFQQLTLRYQDHQFQLDLIKELMRVDPKIK